MISGGLLRGAFEASQHLEVLLGGSWEFEKPSACLRTVSGGLLAGVWRPPSLLGSPGGAWEAVEACCVPPHVPGRSQGVLGSPKKFSFPMKLQVKSVVKS